MSSKIKLFPEPIAFSISKEAVNASNIFSNDIENYVTAANEDPTTFDVKTGASDTGNSGNTKQRKTPTCFYSYYLMRGKRNHPEMEKKCSHL